MWICARQIQRKRKKWIIQKAWKRFRSHSALKSEGLTVSMPSLVGARPSIRGASFFACGAPTLIATTLGAVLGPGMLCKADLCCFKGAAYIQRGGGGCMGLTTGGRTAGATQTVMCWTGVRTHMIRFCRAVGVCLGQWAAGVCTQDLGCAICAGILGRQVEMLGGWLYYISKNACSMQISCKPTWLPKFVMGPLRGNWLYSSMHLKSLDCFWCTLNMLGSFFESAHLTQFCEFSKVRRSKLSASFMVTLPELLCIWVFSTWTIRNHPKPMRTQGQGDLSYIRVRFWDHVCIYKDICSMEMYM